MKKNFCDRCGKELNESNSYYLEPINGIFNFTDIIMLEDKENVKNNNLMMNKLAEYIVKLIDSNTSVYCDDCIKEIKNFAHTKVERKKEKNSENTKWTLHFNDVKFNEDLFGKFCGIPFITFINESTTNKPKEEKLAVNDFLKVVENFLKK